MMFPVYRVRGMLKWTARIKLVSALANFLSAAPLKRLEDCDHALRPRPTLQQATLLLVGHPLRAQNTRAQSIGIGCALEAADNGDAAFCNARCI